MPLHACALLSFAVSHRSAVRRKPSALAAALAAALAWGALAAGTATAQTKAAPVSQQPPAASPAVERALQAVRSAPAVQQVLDGVRADHDRAIAELRQLVQIPAPPFKEQRRAEYVAVSYTHLTLPTIYSV